MEQIPISLSSDPKDGASLTVKADAVEALTFLLPEYALSLKSYII